LIETIVSLLIIVAFLYLSSRKVERYFLMNKYKTVIDLLDHFLDKSYTIIYNDQIIGFTASGQKIIPADEMETIERNFIKLTFELMGPMNKNIFLLFYGSQTALIDNMLLFVRKELDQDALAKIIQEQETSG